MLSSELLGFKMYPEDSDKFRNAFYAASKIGLPRQIWYHVRKEA
jgi:hypothetical protein